MLGILIARFSGQMQQGLADALVTRIVTVAAEELAQSTLRRNDPTAGGVFEKVPGQALDARARRQVRVVEQPCRESHGDRSMACRGDTGVGGFYTEHIGQAPSAKSATLYAFHRLDAAPHAHCGKNFI